MLAPGDRVYCYSDGFTEAMTTDHQPFTTQRVLDCIADARGKPHHHSVVSHHTRSHSVASAPSATGSA